MTMIQRITFSAFLFATLVAQAVVNSDQAAVKAMLKQKDAKTAPKAKQAPVKQQEIAMPDMKAVFAETLAQIKKHPEKQNLLMVLHLDSFIGITPVSDTELKKQEEQLVSELAGKTAKEQEEIVKKAFQQRVNALILTEPAVADFIKQLQKLNIKVIAITDLIPPLAEFIEVRLKNLGLDFSNSGISTQPLQIAVGTNLTVLYKTGILYAGNVSYFEEALSSLLKKTKQTNKQVLFMARVPAEALDSENESEN